MNTKKRLMAASVGLFALAACSDQQLANSNPSAGSGAAAGALAGAALGNLIGKDTESTLVGAAIGAGAGALIGQDLARQKAELESGFQNGQIDVINTGDELIVRMPQDILFAVDSSTVNAGLQSDLRVLADNLNKYPSSIVTVVGHTDSSGDASYNQQLSERRAASVVGILRNGGVASSRLRAVGAGEDRPIATNQTPEGRAQNRRVDITIQPTA
jgi:outer membrane protein OmpA-like peptidoglycan-associated protein